MSESVIYESNEFDNSVIAVIDKSNGVSVYLPNNYEPNYNTWYCDNWKPLGVWKIKNLL